MRLSPSTLVKIALCASPLFSVMTYAQRFIVTRLLAWRRSSCTGLDILTVGLEECRAGSAERHGSQSLRCRVFGLLAGSATGRPRQASRANRFRRISIQVKNENGMLPGLKGAEGIGVPRDREGQYRGEEIVSPGVRVNGWPDGSAGLPQ